VTIDQDDIVSLNGDVVGSLQDLIIRLRNAKESSTAERLRIVGHPESTHGKTVMVMDAAAEAGLRDVQLSVEQQIE
jgi:biopolymer transport protein ExbD